jgi:hypothetical protein
VIRSAGLAPHQMGFSGRQVFIPAWRSVQYTALRGVVKPVPAGLQGFLKILLDKIRKRHGLKPSLNWRKPFGLNGVGMSRLL